MARITEYPEASAPDDNEVVLLDGAEGSKKITIENLFKPLKTAFQAGVDLIYDAIVAKGVTPADSTPAACAEAIGDIETNPTWTEYEEIKINSATNPTSMGTLSITNKIYMANAVSCSVAYISLNNGYTTIRAEFGEDQVPPYRTTDYDVDLTSQFQEITLPPEIPNMQDCMRIIMNVNAKPNAPTGSAIGGTVRLAITRQAETLR